MRWWELDVSYLTIRALALAGLAWDVVLPRPEHQGQPAETPGERRAA
jgi:fatty-acid desaturase